MFTKIRPVLHYYRFLLKIFWNRRHKNFVLCEFKMASAQRKREHTEKTLKVKYEALQLALEKGSSNKEVAERLGTKEYSSNMEEQQR